ncbi:hypothetical protein MAPG_00945 [Magnaporthiopsis poae ATCC 64411]|uniref:Uncharacterized protein n=1 Tax=Magnaporthiopsis poae (strain ATCC 64411 / 73-15) TaxID=644358 RepID=A0A0C4DMD9_MAGP6|nr:hypothetical protein MAPG_00945 [Magnaporthiopsis poae ATCC 64411]
MHLARRRDGAARKQVRGGLPGPLTVHRRAADPHRLSRSGRALLRDPARPPPASRNAIASVLSSSLSAADQDRKNDVLLHVFSNDGSNMATWLLNSSLLSALRDRLDLVVFDCCPGDASLAKAYGAALLFLPPSLSPPVRWFGMAAAYCCVLVISVDDVVSHAHEAQSNFGRDKVGAVLFRSVPHCAPIIKGAHQYWAAIVEAYLLEAPDFSPGNEFANLSKYRQSALGMGLLFPFITLALQASVPQAEVAMAATLVLFFWSFGQVAGVAVGGSILENRWPLGSRTQRCWRISSARSRTLA